MAIGVAMLCACGRIDFDPLDRARDGGGSDDATGSGGDAADAAPSGDAAGGDAVLGGPGETCLTARRIAIGDTLVGESIAGASDDHSSSMCGSGPELVYSYQQPEMVTRTASVNATFSGAMWQALECPPVPGGCQGFGAGGGASARTKPPAGTVYIVVEKLSGTGTTFTIAVQ